VRTLPKKSLHLLICSVLLTTFLSASAFSSGDEKIATVVLEPAAVTWLPHVEYSSLVLSISTPGGEVLRQEFPRGVNPSFSLAGASGGRWPDGHYTYELRLVPVVSAQARAALANAREAGNSQAVAAELKQAGQLPAQEIVQSGSFLVMQGAILVNNAPEEATAKSSVSKPAPQTNQITTTPTSLSDLFIPDNLIVQGEACIGTDCDCYESFELDTLRLKQNNLRLNFDDTSTNPGYPDNDWTIVINENNSGGANKFSIEDTTANKTPFTIIAGAPDNSFYLNSNGKLGLRTATPGLDIHMVTGDTPAIRFDQTNSGGFTPQIWDIGANEANFFVRDLTAGSKLPFRIRPGAPTSSIDISASGDVGIGTDSPAYKLDVAGSVNATGYFLNGAPFNFNVANGTGTTNRLAKWTNGPARTLGDSVMTESGGRIGIGTATPTNIFSVRANGGTAGVHNFGELFVDRDDQTRSASLLLSTGGTLKWIIGMASQTDGFQIYDLATNQARFFVRPDTGNVGIGTSTPQSALQVNGYIQLALTTGAPPGADCDEATEYGRMKVDANSNKLFVCTSTGWKSTTLTP
jgi:hypothetical protein